MRRTTHATHLRESVARGHDVFFFRTFWIKDAMHLNTVGLGNPIKRTCSTCHGMHMTGMDTANGWMDIGTTNLPWASEPPQSPWAKQAPEMPLFKLTCTSHAPHPFLGRAIYTQDPGRALITGRCNDIGTIVMQQFRGLAARAPYFVNGSARDLRELVDFYDRRFNIQYNEEEKEDLINFLSVYERPLPRQIFSASVLLAACALGAEPPPGQRNFVSVPDRARYANRAVLARGARRRALLPGDSDGRLRRFHPPLLGHRVLVEGAVKDAPRICGGIVLEPVKVSPLPELDGTCNTILPAEDRYTVPFAPRPPGPSGGRLAFETAQAPAGAPPPREALTGPQEFTIQYDFDTLIVGRHSAVLTRILAYAQTSGAPRIAITGTAARRSSRTDAYSRKEKTCRRSAPARSPGYSRARGFQPNRCQSIGPRILRRL